MAADIYTKAFNDPDKWAHAKQLINIVPPIQLNNLINNHSIAGRPEKEEPATDTVDSANPQEACPADEIPRSGFPSVIGESSRTNAPNKSDVRRQMHGKRFAEVFSGVGHLAKAFARERELSRKNGTFLMEHLQIF